MSGKYAWSFDGELYEGSFASIREAYDDAAPQSSERPIWIGETYSPDAESYIDADLIIEHITCQDEYSTEWAENWPGATQSSTRWRTASWWK